MKEKSLTITGASVQDRSAHKNDLPDLIYFDGICDLEMILAAVKRDELEFSTWVPRSIQAAILDQFDLLDNQRPVFTDISPFTHTIETAINLNGHSGPPALDGKKPSTYPVYLQGWHSASSIAEHYPNCEAVCTQKDGRAVTKVNPQGYRPKAVIIIQDGQLKKP